MRDACVRGMQSGRRVVSRAQRPMGRRRERRPHRKRDSARRPQGHLRRNPSTSGFTGKPALVLDRPGGIPQGYGLTSRRSVTEPRWVSSPPSYCATAPLRALPPCLLSFKGFVHPRQSAFFIHISQRTAGDRWGRLGTAGDGWGRLGTAGDAGDRWGSRFVTAFTYDKFINWP